MNIIQIETVGGPRNGVRTVGVPTFETKNIVEIAIACYDNVTGTKHVKKIVGDYEKAIAEGLYGSPAAILPEIKKEDYCCKILSVRATLINDKLVIFGRVSMTDTKYGKAVRRMLAHPHGTVWGAPILKKVDGKTKLYMMEIDI
jgi:hypothetical protein